MDLLRFCTPNAADLGVNHVVGQMFFAKMKTSTHWEPTRPETSKFKCLASKVNIAKYIYM